MPQTKIFAAFDARALMRAPGSCPAHRHLYAIANGAFLAHVHKCLSSVQKADFAINALAQKTLNNGPPNAAGTALRTKQAKLRSSFSRPPPAHGLSSVSMPLAHRPQLLAVSMAHDRPQRVAQRETNPLLMHLGTLYSTPGTFIISPCPARPLVRNFAMASNVPHTARGSREWRDAAGQLT